MSILIISIILFNMNSLNGITDGDDDNCSLGYTPVIVRLNKAILGRL